MSALILYSTLGCHLCELAENVIKQALTGGDYSLNIVDITEDATLMDQYSIRIPVVYSVRCQAELGWPFDHDMFTTWWESLGGKV